MNGAHLHLMLTHVPVAGIAFGLLILAYALWKDKKDAVQVSFGVFAASGIVAGAAYLTGEEAEEVVEDLANISRDLIHAHEDMALFALIAAVVLGVVSLAGLWFSRKALPRWITYAVFVVALVAGSIMAWTANLGGEINHPEIRSSNPGGTGVADHDDD